MQFFNLGVVNLDGVIGTLEKLSGVIYQTFLSIKLMARQTTVIFGFAKHKVDIEIIF